MPVAKTNPARALTDLLFDKVDAGLCLVAPDGTVVRANAEWLRATRFTEEQVVGENIIDLFPETRDMALALHARARAGHRVEVPRHAQVVNGREAWWEGSIEPVPMEGGTGLLITAREVGALRAETASADVRRLLAERDRAIDLLEHGDAFYVLDSEFRYVLVNDAQEASSGKKRSETLGRRIWDVWPEAASPRFKFWEVYHRVMRERVAEAFEEYFPPLDLWTEIRVFPTAEGGIAAFFRRINDRKHAEDALAAETEKYRSLFQHSLDAVYLTRADGTILDANPAACRLHGMTVDEIRKAGRAGLVVGDERSAAALEERATTGNARAELTMRRKDGATVAVETQSVLLDPTRSDARAFVIARDISGRKRSEEELRRREEEARAKAAELESILGCIADGVLVYDREGRTIRSNPAADEILGIPVGERGAPVRDRVSAQYEITDETGRRVPPDEMVAIRAAIRGEVVRRTVNRVQSRGHEPRWLMLSATPLFIEGRHAGAVLSMTDVTERKRAEEAIRDSEERLRALGDNLPDGAVYRYQHDEAGRPRFLHISRGIERLTGVAPEEILRDPAALRDTVLRADRDLLDAEEQRSRDALAPFELEVRQRHRVTGEERWALLRSVPTRLPDGQTVWDGIHIDITARKRAEEALRRTESILQYAGAMARLGAWWIEISDPDDLDASPLNWSNEVYRLFGYEPGGVEVSNALFFEHVHPEDRERVGDAVARSIATKQPYRVEHRILPRGGPERVVLEYGAFEFDAAGRPTRLVGAVQDVTETKKVQDALREADRRKDEFLGMLSHELRNPLAPIRNSTYILRRAAPGSEQARRAQEVIERQTEHITRLVDDLLDITRISRGKIELRRTKVDLREVVLRAADDFRLLIEGRGVAFRLEVPTARLLADADATRLTQVVGNLLHNAAKFTSPGDEVSLSLGAAEGEAEIRVRDTGAGIEPALLPTIFDAFVQGTRTLARTEGGLGLGLAMVKGIAELHGGAVHAESAGVGRGAEFVVRLPLVSGAVAREPPSVGGRPTGRRRVLVVDDNRDGAESLAEILRLLGHDVDVAYDGPSALEAVRAHSPDVVLCDIGLPGMSGYEVAKALREAGTAARLYAVSGYALPEDVKRAAEAGFDGHLAKPFDPEQIERLLA